MSNIENSFCSLSFAEHYLSRLNKSALNPFDQKLLVYIQKITKEQRKNFSCHIGFRFIMQIKN